MKIQRLCDDCGAEVCKVGSIDNKTFWQCPKCKKIEISSVDIKNEWGFLFSGPEKHI